MASPDRTAPRTTRRPSDSAQRTRAAVLRAAIDEFAEHGLAGGRVDRIAKRAGVNKQALYYHYGDKEKLFEAALVYGYTRFEMRGIDWRSDPRPPAQLMKHIVEAFYDLVYENRNHMALIADENRNGGKHLTPAVVRHIRKSTAAAREAIHAVLERGQRAGVFSKDIDAAAIYLAIAGLPMFYFDHHHTLSAILEENAVAPRRVAARRHDFVKIILAALRRPA